MNRLKYQTNNSNQIETHSKEDELIETSNNQFKPKRNKKQTQSTN